MAPRDDDNQPVRKGECKQMHKKLIAAVWAIVIAVVPISGGVLGWVIKQNVSAATIQTDLSEYKRTQEREDDAKDKRLERIENKVDQLLTRPHN